MLRNHSLAQPARGEDLWLGRGGREQCGRCAHPLRSQEIRQRHHPQCPRRRLDDPEGRKLMSLRRAAFLWLASLMAAVGISAAAASYFLVRNEAGDFLDNQLRQIAIYVGDTPPEADGTLPGAAPHDPEDDFVIQVWDAVAKPLRLSDPGADIP